MAEGGARNVFINMPVADLQRALTFFRTLGFEFDPQYTNDGAACLILGPNSFAMLLATHRFKSAIRREICNTQHATEMLVAISCKHRAEVSDLVHRALAAGGKRALDPQEHGFRYGWSFYDLDGHHWEVVWMDPAVANRK